MSKANILIGLGGTGAKILAELAELLSQDGKWRSLVDTDLYYLLIDTDAGDLEKYRNRIQRTLPDIYCAAVPLAQDLASLAPLLQPWHDSMNRISKDAPEKHSDGLRRFAGHWWFVDQAKPSMEPLTAFSAYRVLNIHQGAGQVPAVSHFCAWNSMKAISAAYLELFTNVKRRRANLVTLTDSPIKEPNVFFLGSFAGGTGRGALLPCAFRFKQDFYQEFKSTVSPSLYVFDASCFETAIDAAQLPAIRMNALSGFSELSAWEQLHRSPMDRDLRSLLYSLPGADNPADPAHDAVSFASAKTTELTGFIRPFDAISITFRKADAIEASRPEQLYSMLAGALYVRMTQSAIDSMRANEGRGLLSIGSASCRVDVQSIKDYYRDKARYDTLFNLKAPADPRAAREKAAELGAEILARRIPLKGAGRALFTEDTPPADRTKAKSVFEIFTALVLEEGEFGGQALNVLHEALSRDKLNDVTDALRDRFDPVTSLQSEKFIAAAGMLFARAMEEFARFRGEGEYRDLDGWVETVIADIVSTAAREHPSVFARSGSAALCGGVAKFIGEQISDFASHALSRSELIKLNNDAEPDLPGLIEAIKPRSAWLIGKRFDEAEIQRAMRTARLVITLTAARALGLALKKDPGPLTGLRQRLASIETNAGCLADISSYLIQDVDADSLAKARRDCFVTRDATGRIQWQDLVNSLLDFDSDQRFVKRIIKPLEPTAQDGLTLVTGQFGDTISQVLSGKEIPENRRKAVQNAELLETVRSALQRHVRYVAFTAESGIQQDVSTMVQFGPAIRKLWDAWTDELNHHLQDPDFGGLSQKFYNFFGVEPRIAPNRDSVRIDITVPGVNPADYPVVAMSVSLARTCHAFWRLNNQREDPRVIVMLPVDVAPGDRPAWDTWLSEQIGGRVQLIPNESVTLSNGEKVTHNPFILSAYCSEGCARLDEVESLRYWSTNADVKQLMERIDRVDMKPAQFATEDDPGKPYADRSPFPGYRGSGFADPCYLFNPALRSLRWRPWAAAEAPADTAAAATRSP